MFDFIRSRLSRDKKKEPEKVFTRQDFVNSIPKNIKILEIGPFYSLLLNTNKVKYFDVLSQRQLKKRATSIGQSEFIDKIPKIDYVSPTGNLKIIHEKFDAVISSHVIEHQIDLIAHLQNVSDLLKKNGLYYLLIPDKRYTFDHYLPVSDLASIIARHYEVRKNHSLKSVIEHRAFTTHSDSIRHWNGDNGNIKKEQRKRINTAVKEYKKSNGKNIDVHAWYFTPNSFTDIIGSLRDLGYITLTVEKIYPTENNSLEFFAVLQK